jgi:hypothetical protein
MDSKKLAQIIKLVVEQEIKKQLPKLVKEEVEKKMKVLQERKTTPIKEVEQDPFALAESLLQRDRQTQQTQQIPQKQFTKNPTINEILNQTQPFTAEQRTAGPVGGGSSILDNFQTQQPISEGYGNSHIPNYMDAEPDIEGTMTFDNPVTSQVGLSAMRQQMAAKMGYGDMTGGAQRGGLGVTTGLAGLDRILNRDNSELVKKFKR